MATFRKGAANITKAAEGTTQSKYVNTLAWKPDQKRYIQFLTDLEDMPTVLYHGFIITGRRESGTPIFDSFVSRRDPALDGNQGYDPLIDRWGQKPSHRTLGVAAELIPTFKEEKGRKKPVSVTLATRTWMSKESGEVTAPGLYVVNQAPSNFFGYLASWEEDTGRGVSEVVWSITRRGGPNDTNYDMIEVNGVQPLDLSGVMDQAPNLDEYLTSISDLDRVHELLDRLPDNWVISSYPTKGAATAAKAPKSVPDSNDESPPWKEKEDAEEPMSFEALKNKVAKK